MLALKYTTLSNVEAGHSYYIDGQCREVHFEPFKSTLEGSGEYNIKFGDRPGKIKILGRVEEVNGIINLDPPLTAPVCLQFFLKITESSLAATAELDGTKQFYLSNLFPDFTVNNLLLTQGPNLSSLDASPKVYPNTYSATVSPGLYKSVTIKRYWPGGLLQFRKAILEETNETIRIANLPDGRYRVELEKSDGTVQVEEIFASAQARDTNAWLAIVEIFLTPALLADLSNPPTFNFTFAFKSKAWKYFIVDLVNKKPILDPNVAHNLGIVYSVEPQSRLPNIVNFSKVDPNSYSSEEKKMVEALLKNTQVKDVYLFNSQSPIPFLFGDSPKLELNDAATKLIPELPVPSSGSPDASIFVNI